MRKIGLLLLLVLLVGLAAGCISDSHPSRTQTSGTATSGDYVVVNGTKIYLDKIHFYMYGMKTCPHCRRMHTLIPETYGNDSLTYYELVGNEENIELFRAQYNITGIGGVPAIAITYNGTIYALIEGEFNVSMTPKIIAVAMQNNGTVLFVRGKAYILPRTDPEVREDLKKLYEIYVEHRLPDNSTG